MMRKELFRHRNFRLLFAGQALNMFGDQSMIIVLGIWVKSLTGSNSAAGLIFMVLAIPAPLAPFTGLLVDRLPRRRVLIVNDLLSALLVLSLLLVRDRGQVWLIYLVAFGYGLSFQVYRAARGGLVHSMLPEELLGEANGIFSALGQGLRIIGPVVGAGLFGLFGGGAVASLDAATFVLSAGFFVVLRRVPDLARERPAEPPRLLHELMAGARHVLRTPQLRLVVLSAAVAFSAAAMVDVAIFALVDQGLHRPATFIGLLVAAQGAGSVVAGLAIGAVLRRIGEIAAASVGFALCGAGLGLVGTAALPAVVVGAALAGLGLPTVLVANMTLLQRRTSNELQGRVIAASEAMIDIPFAVSIGLGALVISVVGYRTIYLADAAVFAIVAALLLRSVSETRPVATPAPAS
jgi:MFS family permease